MPRPFIMHLKFMESTTILFMCLKHLVILAYIYAQALQIDMSGGYNITDRFINMH